MRKITYTYLIAALFILACVVTVTVWLVSWRSSDQNVRIVRPESPWKRGLYHSIDPIARLSGQTDLRSDDLAKGNVEMRIWWLIGLSPVEGLSLRRIDGQWSAIHVKADNASNPQKVDRKELPLPKSGWDAAWARLVNGGILTLPDPLDTGCELATIDGMVFAVEINSDMRYRTYYYLHPDAARCKEATQMLKIFEVVIEEFRLGE